jgi:23S rRNA (guanosine2251-2'-O)-methyltransferase
MMQKETDYIFGLRPVIEAIKSGKQIDRLLIQHGLQGSLQQELMALVRNYKIEYQIVPDKRLDLITRRNHQGVVAWISVVEYQSISNLLPSLFENGEDPLIVALDRISDVRNFGAIVRTADCLGAHGIVIPRSGSARITADAVKTSAGALNSFPVCREKSLFSSIEYMKDSGLKVVSASEKSGEKVSDIPLNGPLVLIMGSEDRGISRELISLSDHQARIPMSGSIGSLNVSVAAGIILYEIARQRSE